MDVRPACQTTIKFNIAASDLRGPTGSAKSWVREDRWYWW